MEKSPKSGSSRVADTVEHYLSRAAEHELLTKEQEQTLGWQIVYGRQARAALESSDSLSETERAELELKIAEGQDARNTMIESNLRLVVQVARRQSHIARGMEFADLLQYGNMGLIRAVDRFDPSKGFKFSTYAMYWIKQSVMRNAYDHEDIIKVPDKVKKFWLAYRDAKESLQAAGIASPTAEQIMEVSGINPSDFALVETAERNSLRMLSLDHPLGDGQVKLEDYVFDHHDDTEQAGLAGKARAEMADYIEQLFAVADLSPKELEAVRFRSGLHDGQPLEYGDIARLVGNNPDNIGAQYRKGIKKLKMAAELIGRAEIEELLDTVA